MELDPEALVADLPLSTRAKTVLEYEGIKKVKDIVNLDFDRLRTAPRCGKKTITELIEMFGKGQDD